MARDGIVRLLREPFLEDLDRLVDVAERAVRERQQPARLGMLRPQRDHLREADRRFVRALLAVQQHAEVVVRVRVLGIDANGVAIRRFRFDRLAFRPQDDAEVVVRVGVARLERDRAPVGGDRVVELEPVLQDDAEIAVPVRAIGLELEASLDQRDRLLAPRLLVGEHAGEVQRVGVVRCGFEDAAVDLVRGRPLLGLLQHDGDRDRLVEAEGAILAGQRLARASLPCCP